MVVAKPSNPTYVPRHARYYVWWGLWEGYVVHSCHEQADGSLLIDLAEDPRYAACYGRCGQPCVLVHERRWRRIRERDWFDRRVWLNAPVRRKDCHHSDARVTEGISWLAAHARITQRLRAWVEALVQLLPIAHVAQLTGLHWHAIKEIDRLRLEAKYGQFDGDGVRRLVMDDKGHRYATVVMDAETMRGLMNQQIPGNSLYVNNRHYPAPPPSPLGDWQTAPGTGLPGLRRPATSHPLLEALQ